MNWEDIPLRGTLLAPVTPGVATSLGVKGEGPRERAVVSVGKNGHDEGIEIFPDLGYERYGAGGVGQI